MPTENWKYSGLLELSVHARRIVDPETVNFSKSNSRGITPEQETRCNESRNQQLAAAVGVDGVVTGGWPDGYTCNWRGGEGSEVRRGDYAASYIYSAGALHMYTYTYRPAAAYSRSSCQ